jgi:hypothetical protein
VFHYVDVFVESEYPLAKSLSGHRSFLDIIWVELLMVYEWFQIGEQMTTEVSFYSLHIRDKIVGNFESNLD